MGKKIIPLRKDLMLGVLLMVCLFVFSGTALAAKLPRKDEMEERWFFWYGGEYGGQDWLEFPHGTKLSDFETSTKDLQLNIAVEKCPDGRVFLVIKAVKPLKRGTVRFKATLNGKSRTYKTKVVAMEYKNPFGILKIGKKDYASKYKKFDNTFTVKKTVKGKLKVKASPGFRIEGMKLLHNFDEENGKTLKNGDSIRIRKGDSLQIYYYYKRYKAHCGLGVIYFE